MGIAIAMFYVTPPTLQARGIYAPFGWMPALAAVHALVSTLLVRRVPGSTPVPVEQVLEHDSVRHGR
ncbi:MAG: hypothetical protein KGL18_20175 [Burkholderiales bacterium]|nr:hypothetical protein [Burkholderiales bacterium]MDE1927139.1 hypothetical protein [Burkholderiales bacterium]MDE2505286.1 hypothetical protein [Burkholderiales bacterium]